MASPGTLIPQHLLLVPKFDALPEDFPPAMRSEFSSDWQNEGAARIFQRLTTAAPLSLRFSRRVDRDELVSRWRSSGKFPVRITLSSLSPWGVLLEGYTPVFRTPEYERGDFEIQDEGSQVMAAFTLWPEEVAPLLSDSPAELKVQGGALALLKASVPASWKVVDACAGAGGKSLALADLMKGQGRIFSYDISATKLQALRRRASHAGVTNIQAIPVTEGQESESLMRFEKTADRVLVDAPCSGWGVLRRNPDIKWRQSSAALSRFPEIQLRLLEAYSQLTKPGGVLVYGTCTFRKAETTAVVHQFLERNGAQFSKGPGGFLGPGSSDGFFMQSFTRT
jgi:16S rRNA (cytosine967-C5)-methyltransferase